MRKTKKERDGLHARRPGRKAVKEKRRTRNTTMENHDQFWQPYLKWCKLGKKKKTLPTLS